MWLKNFKLLRGFLNGEVAYTGPVFITVNMTRVCNMNCQGCQFHSSRKRKTDGDDDDGDYISIDVIDSLCESLPRLETREVFLSGQGEPLFHPSLINIIKSLKHAGCAVQLFTNGTLLNERMAHELVSSGLDALRVSLWAINSQEYEKCYPGVNPKNLQKTLDGIRMIVNMKNDYGQTQPMVFLTAPLNRHNWRSIEDRVRLTRELGCDGVLFDMFRHWGKFSSESLSPDEIAALCNHLNQVKPLLKSLSLKHNIDDVLLQYRLGEAAWRSLPCYVGWFHAHIQVNGSIVPCSSCKQILGHLTHMKFDGIWNGPDYRAFRKKTSSAQGTSAIRSDCYCDWCCLGKSNYKVHRLFKWLDPFIPGRKIWV